MMTIIPKRLQKADGFLHKILAAILWMMKIQRICFLVMR